MTAVRARHYTEAFVGLLVVVVLIVAIWFGYWWLALRVRSHQNVVNRASYEYQSTYATQVRSDIVQVRGLDVTLAATPDDAAAAAQRKALIVKTCGDAAQVQDKGTFFGTADPSTQAFIDANC